MSDFPEFDRAYNTVLVKDPEDRFEQLAAEANFNVYHSDIWRGTGRKFAELIIEECMYVMDCNKGGDQHPEWNRALFETIEKIEQHFGVE
jgi:hypothetical protein